MRNVAMHLPQAQIPVPALFGQLLTRPNSEPVQPFAYLCFHLTQPELTPELHRRLEALGVECLSSGEFATAYGIARKDDDLLELIASDREIVAVEIHEPSAGK